MTPDDSIVDSIVRLRPACEPAARCVELRDGCDRHRVTAWHACDAAELTRIADAYTGPILEPSWKPNFMPKKSDKHMDSAVALVRCLPAFARLLCSLALALTTHRSYLAPGRLLRLHGQGGVQRGRGALCLAFAIASTPMHTTHCLTAVCQAIEDSFGIFVRRRLRWCAARGEPRSACRMRAICACDRLLASQCNEGPI